MALRFPSRRAPARRTPSPRSRGTALFTTLVALMVMSIAGLALAGRGMQGVHLSHIQRDESVALNIAESAAEYGMLWLHNQSSPPTGTATLHPYANVAFGGGTYSVDIIPDANNFTVALALPHYTIVGTGGYGSRKEIVQLYVQLKSLANWAYFNNVEDSSLWYITGMQMDGPVHSNNANGNLMNIDWVGSTSPIFLDTVSVVASSMNYYPAAPVGDSQYKDIYKEGAAGVQLSSFSVPLPSTTTAQKNAAWGSSSGFPSTTGVYVPVSGSTCNAGIYVQGDSTVNFSTDSTHPAWQILTIVQGSTTTKITIERDTNQTVKQVGAGTPVTYVGVPNGSIFCEGNVTSLQGTLADNTVSGSTVTARNAYTLTTDVAAGKTTTITGNLVYTTTPDKTKPWNDPSNLNPGALGIITRKVVLAGGVAPTNLNVDAIMLAGGAGYTDGQLTVSNYSSAPAGNFNCIGGLIEDTAGVTGVFNQSTGLLSSGYLEHYHYDYRLYSNPPPYFPTTNGYQKISWQVTFAGPNSG